MRPAPRTGGGTGPGGHLHTAHRLGGADSGLQAGRGLPGVAGLAVAGLARRRGVRSGDCGACRAGRVTRRHPGEGLVRRGAVPVGSPAVRGSGSDRLVAAREGSEDTCQGSETKPEDRQEAENDTFGVGMRRASLCVCLSCANMLPTQKR